VRVRVCERERAAARRPQRPVVGRSVLVDVRAGELVLRYARVAAEAVAAPVRLVEVEVRSGRMRDDKNEEKREHFIE